MLPPFFRSGRTVVPDAYRLDLGLYMSEGGEVIGGGSHIHPGKVDHPVARPAPGDIGTVVDGPHDVAVGASVRVAAVPEPCQRRGRIDFEGSGQTDAEERSPFVAGKGQGLG